MNLIEEGLNKMNNTLYLEGGIKISFSTSGPRSEDSLDSIFWGVDEGHWRLGGEIILSENNAGRTYEQLIREDYEASKNDWRKKFHNFNQN